MRGGGKEEEPRGGDEACASEERGSRLACIARQPAKIRGGQVTPVRASLAPRRSRAPRPRCEPVRACSLAHSPLLAQNATIRGRGAARKCGDSWPRLARAARGRSGVDLLAADPSSLLRRSSGSSRSLRARKQARPGTARSSKGVTTRLGPHAAVLDKQRRPARTKVVDDAENFPGRVPSKERLG